MKRKRRRTGKFVHGRLSDENSKATVRPMLCATALSIAFMNKLIAAAGASFAAVSAYCVRA